MKIYLDSILLENIIVNYILMYQVNIFTKSEAKRGYRILSTIVLSIYTVATYIVKDSIVDSIIIKLLTVTIAVYIAFRPKQIKIFLKQLVYFYIISFTYVGIIISITLVGNIKIEGTVIKIAMYLLSGVISYLFNKYLWKMWKTNIKKDDLAYTINVKGQEIPSFIDTGNVARSQIHQLDVIFIDYSWYGILELLDVLKKKVDISIHSVSGDNICYGYLMENVLIYKQGTFITKLDKIIFSFSNQKINIDDKYTALIGYHVYLENLKGVTL